MNIYACIFIYLNAYAYTHIYMCIYIWDIVSGGSGLIISSRQLQSSALRLIVKLRKDGRCFF